MRFSAIRQLTWQRKYNTKPKELAHAQDRLTHKLAQIYRNEPGSRLLVRLTLATVGRGGEGQRIRDEIGLGPHDYRLKIRGAVVGQGIAYAGRLLAVPPAGLGSRPRSSARTSRAPR